MAEQIAFLSAYSRTSGGHAPLGREHGTGGLDSGGRLLKGQGVVLVSLWQACVLCPLMDQDNWYLTSQ